MNAKSKAVVAGALIVAAVLAYGILSNKSAANPNDASGIKAQAGLTESRQTISAGGSTSSSGDARVTVRSAVLMNESSHPLMAEVAGILREQLSSNGTFETVRLHAREQGAIGVEANGRPADVVIRLAERKLSREGVVKVRFKGEVELAMGTAPYASNHHYSTHLTPPTLEFNWKALLETDSEFTGFSTDLDRNIAESVAKKLAEAVAAQIKEHRENYGAFPPLPDGMYGQAGPVPDPGISPSFRARVVASHPGLLAHNETTWLSPIQGDPGAMMEKIASEAEQAGWKKYDFTGGDQPHLRMTREDRTLMAFTTNSDGIRSGESAAPAQLVVRYRHAFSEAETAAAVSQMFATSLSPEELLPFAPMLPDPEQRRFEQRIREAAHNSPALYLYLASRSDDTAEALPLLTRAQALARVHPSESKLMETIRARRKKLTGNEDGPALQPETFRQAGFQEIGVGEAAVELVKKPGELAAFYTSSSQGKPVAIGLHIAPSQQSPVPTFSTVIASGGTRSSSTRGLSKDHYGLWSATVSEIFNELRLEFEVQQLGSGEYRYIAKASPL